MVVFIGIEDCQKLQLFDSSFFTALSSCEVPTPTNGAARFKPHCFILGPGSGTRFLKMITPTVPDLFCWWQPIFTWKGEQFKAMFFFCDMEILWERYPSRVRIFETCLFMACFYPCRNNLIFQNYVPWMIGWASSWWRALDDGVCIYFHIFSIVPASSMWLFDSSNRGVKPWKGRSWRVFSSKMWSTFNWWELSMIASQQTQLVGGSLPWIVSPVFLGLCNHIEEVDLWVGRTGCTIKNINEYQWHMFWVDYHVCLCDYMSHRQNKRRSI